MCGLVNMEDNLKDIETPIYKQSSKLVRNVYSGEISPFVLPNDLYLFSFFSLSTQMSIGFGLPSDFKRGTFSFKRATQMKNNLSIFSGAKTFQNILELSSNVFAGGQKTPFNDFKKLGLSINDQYNKHWLNTEQQAAFSQSQSVEKWKEVQEDADVFPYLKYVTVGDSRVRHKHEEQDGIIKRVDDPFWSTWFPPNGWKCRCIVQQIETAKVTKGTFTKNDDEVFGQNVGKTGLIFPKKHPYFDMPKEFKTAQKQNFGFITPTDEQIKTFI